MISWLLATGVLAGTGCLAAAIYLGSDEDWRPVEVPMPGAGLEVAMPFHLETAGRFELNATVPEVADKGVAMRERPTLACDILAQVDGPNGERSEQQLRSFRHYGEYPFGSVQFYSAGEITLPRRGDYTMRVTNRADVPLFRSNGALFRMERIAEPSAWLLGGMLARSAGFLVLLATAAGLAVQRVQRARAR